MSTLREHLEAPLARHVAWVNGLGERTCVWCKHEWPCLDAEDAVAALAILSEAERLSLYYGEPEAHTWAVVPDPGPAA